MARCKLTPGKRQGGPCWSECRRIWRSRSLPGLSDVSKGIVPDTCCGPLNEAPVGVQWTPAKKGENSVGVALRLGQDFTAGKT